MKVAGIYLAGGNSKRMGTSKLALPVGTKTLGSFALETILQTPLEKVFVVVQQADSVTWLSDELKHHSKCSIIHCPRAHIGQSQTLHCGINAAKAQHMDAVIIFLADQPFITIQLIENMIACMQESTKSQFIATSFDQAIYPPVLLKKELFHTLLQVKGDIGAKALLKGDFLNHGKVLPCNDQRLVFDIDTRDDFKKLVNEYSSRQIKNKPTHR